MREDKPSESVKKIAKAIFSLSLKIRPLAVGVYVNINKVATISARIELFGKDTLFVASEISKKTSEIFFKDGMGNQIVGMQSITDIRENSGFLIDKSLFDAERIDSIRLYYSKLKRSI